jgi:hypothetical protein
MDVQRLQRSNFAGHGLGETPVNPLKSPTGRTLGEFHRLQRSVSQLRDFQGLLWNHWRGLRIKVPLSPIPGRPYMRRIR